MKKKTAIKILICTQFFNEIATSTLDCHNLTLLFRLPINVCAMSVPSDSLRAVTKIGEKKKKKQTQIQHLVMLNNYRYVCLISNAYLSMPVHKYLIFSLLAVKIHFKNGKCSLSHTSQA